MGTVNERISELIKAEGLNPNSFAKKLGMRDTSIRNITSGRNNPSFEILSKILDAFSDYSPLWLVNGTGPMKLDQFEKEINYIKGGNEFTSKSEQTILLEIKFEHGKVVAVNNIPAHSIDSVTKIAADNNEAIKILTELVISKL